jgi:hypothetical protein
LGWVCGGGVWSCEPPEGGVGLSRFMRSRSMSLSLSSPLIAVNDVASGLLSRPLNMFGLREPRNMSKGETGISRPPEVLVVVGLARAIFSAGRAKSVDEDGREGLSCLEEVAI